MTGIFYLIDFRSTFILCKQLLKKLCMDLVLTKSRNASMYGSCLFFKNFFCLVKTVKLHMFNEYGNEVKTWIDIDQIIIFLFECLLNNKCI